MIKDKDRYFFDITTNFKNFFGYLYIMRIMVSEKQLRRIIDSEVDMSEQEGGGETSTETGIPKMGDRVGREGPANQIGLTKWETVVGSKLTRGPANPLWKK